MKDGKSKSVSGHGRLGSVDEIRPAHARGCFSVYSGVDPCYHETVANTYAMFTGRREHIVKI